jgi:protein phosphatase
LYVCSDGLWDVINTKRAVQFVVEVKDPLQFVLARTLCTVSYESVVLMLFFPHILQGKDRNRGDCKSADKVANSILSEARNLQTKDNTSVIFVDFDILRRGTLV